MGGLARWGTTFLHGLVAMDQANQIPRVWQLIDTYPALAASRYGDRRQQQVGRQLRVFGMLAPEFPRMHPIRPDSPQECSEITAHVFASLRFDSTYSVPSYRRGLDNIGHLDAPPFPKPVLHHPPYHARRTPPQRVQKPSPHVPVHA